MSRRLAVSGAFVALALMGAAPAPRPPDQRQILTDLAYVLGEAHALRSGCAVDDDQTWRLRMSQLLEVEAPDATFRRRLVDSFNTGFVSRQAERRACGPDAAAAERGVAARGRDLAARLGTD